MQTNSLKKPFSSNTLELKNRVVMAPMTRSMSPHNIPRENVAKYYRRRAEGGVGLIISEGTAIGHKASHGYPDVPNFHGKEALAAWKIVIDEVHAAGGKMFPQLWHVGSVRQTHAHKNTSADNPDHVCNKHHVPGYAPSPIPHPSVVNGEIPKEMTRADIQDVIEAYAQAATEAKRLGFDGVEVHGAHGYLIDQFFWEVTNKRTDEYGGKTAAERTRFGVEVIKAIRESVGPDYPIMLRYSQFKLGDYQAKLAKDPKELESFLNPLAKAGVDIFHCSTRVFSNPEFEGSALNLAGWTKKITGKPTVTVGSVGLEGDFVAGFKEGMDPKTSNRNLAYLLESLDKGEYDLVAVGRALLADPDWLQKIEKHEYQSIKPFHKELLAKLE